MSERNILILGASSDVAIEFIKKSKIDYDRFFLHFRNMNSSFSETISTLGEKATLLQADLSQKNEVETLCEKIKYENISHVLCLTSAPAVNLKFHKSDSIIFESMINTNVMGIIPALQVVLSKMIKLKFGRIVFCLSSYVCNTPPKFQSPYITAKYALLGLMKSLSVDYINKGITVNAISPDMMNTKFLKDIPSLIVEQHAESSALKRNLNPSDLISSLKFFLSDDNVAITGQNLLISV